MLDAFQWVPDPRASQGRRHPLPAILALATAAMLSGANSLYAIAQWGRLQSPEVVRALGFTRATTPSVSTLHEVFKLIDGAVLEAVLAAWTQTALDDGVDAIAIDGKAQRGRHGRSPTSGVDLVAAYTHRTGHVLAQSGGRGQ